MKKNNRSYLNFKTDMLRNQKRIPSILAGVKYGYDTRVKVSDLINNIYISKLPGKEFLFQGLVPEKIENIGSVIYIPHSSNDDILKELKWAYNIISHYHNEINQFINIKEMIEYNILIGEIETAENINKGFCDDVGLSIWSLETTFLIMELTNGFEANKEYLETLSKGIDNSILKVLVDFYSTKVDENCSYVTLSRRLELFLEHNSDGSFYYDVVDSYLRYKLLLQTEDLTAKDYELIMSVESTMSIFDYYESFIKVVANILSREMISGDACKEIVGYASHLSKVINDYRLEKILVLFDRKNIDSYFMKYKHKTFENIIEMYTMSNYEGCEKLISSAEKMGIMSYELLEAHAKSHVMIGKNSHDISNMFNKITSLMINVIACDNKISSLSDVINETKAISNFNISYGIVQFIESSFLLHDRNIGNRRIGFIFSKHISPRDVFLFDSSRRQDLLDEFKVQETFEETVELIEIFSSENPTRSNLIYINDLRKKYYLARSCTSKRDASILLEEIRVYTSGLTDIADRYYYERSSKEIYKNYLYEKDYVNALRIVVDSYFEDEGFIIRMDIQELNESIKYMSENEKESIYGNTKWPVFSFISDERDHSELYNSLMLFLESNGIFDPLDLELLINYFSGCPKELNFILFNLYKFDIIKRYPFFELENKYSFRIAVLEHLVVLDRMNQTIYLKEKETLIFEQGIKEKSKSIGKEKIFADVKRIMIENQEIFKDKFSQYLLLSEIGSLIGSDIYSLKSLKDLINDDFVFDSNLKQNISALKDIIIEFRSQFLFNSNYGLDKFLSTRIRHGMLDNYLLKPFNNCELLATDPTKSSINTYWKRRSEVLNIKTENDIYSSIIGAFNDFSVEITTKVNEVKEWTKIFSRANPEGMFKYEDALDPIIIDVFYNEIKDSLNYDVFYRKIASIFWQITDFNLKEVRKKINEEVRNSFVESISQLERKIQSINKYGYLPLIREIQHKINEARTMISNDIDNVINWFYIGADNEYEDYSMSEVLKILEESYQKINNDYQKIQVNINCDDTILKGKSFVYMWDILNILYSNSIIHSDESDFTNLRIDITSKLIEMNNMRKIDVIDDEGLLKLVKSMNSTSSPILLVTVRNSLGSNVDKTVLECTIKDKFRSIEDIDEYKKLVATEGGSGLVKLKSMLINLGASHLVQYVTSDDSIEFKLYLDISNLRRY